MASVSEDNTSTRAAGGQAGQGKARLLVRTGIREPAFFAVRVRGKRETTAYLLRTARHLELPEPAGAFVVGIRARLSESLSFTRPCHDTKDSRRRSAVRPTALHGKLQGVGLFLLK